MSYNTKNYREQGGEKTVIGGEVILAANAKVTIDPAAIIDGLPGGNFTPAASQVDSTATTIEELVMDFNALLAKLRSAGLMAS
ncbi:Head fiber protein [Sphaerochaeta pleomorpha str. Grapes]|uniref:Head fiber protein n=1 Tax=Sphaerochaeta pleomorpha (strain ATCC BAA-1885 / DSM 22778 / Grapes) TaxID=158190 RepID=G8QWK3_SPHPG|nr:head fiber protein [Sphaerochaeta pleomorpha]AEV30579.1 Head fiber protein [Sphaerochaeta pleomorpha str. Grapes]